MDRVLYVAAGVATLGTALEVLRRAVGWMIGVARKLSRLADDLLGEPPRPGLPEGRPGLMDRVASIERRLVVLEELLPNGGTTKDHVATTATQ